MAGLTPQSPWPVRIEVLSQSRVMEIEFSDGAVFQLPFELMRVLSPSAEVRSHGPGTEGPLPVNKQDVEIVDMIPVGQYAIKPVFSDGHDSGLYSWDYLYDLGKHRETLWQDYQQRRNALSSVGDTGNTQQEKNDDN